MFRIASSTIPLAVKQGCQPWTVLSFGRKRLPLRIGKNSGCVAVYSPAGRGGSGSGGTSPDHASGCGVPIRPALDRRPLRSRERRPAPAGSSRAPPRDPPRAARPRHPALASASARRHTAPETHTRRTQCPRALGPRWRASRPTGAITNRRHPSPREAVSPASRPGTVRRRRARERAASFAPSAWRAASRRSPFQHSGSGVRRPPSSGHPQWRATTAARGFPPRPKPVSLPTGPPRWARQKRQGGEEGGGNPYD